MIELREAEVAALIDEGLLKTEMRNQLRAVRGALYLHLDRTLGSGRVSGSVSGAATGNQIQVHTDGPGFAAKLQLVTRRDRQSVSIRSAGAEIAAVAITLARGAN